MSSAATPAPEAPRPVAVKRLDHAVLFVADLVVAVDLNEQVLGFAVMATEPRANAALLRAGGSDDHHDLGLFGLGPNATPKQRGQVGLSHLVWQVATLEDLALEAELARWSGVATA